jgi:lysophospholipase L1-like esterase
VYLFVTNCAGPVLAAIRRPKWEEKIMKTMICIGDSLTEGADIVKEYRWPQRVGNALAMNVTNQGIGGDTTQEC